MQQQQQQPQQGEEEEEVVREEEGEKYNRNKINSFSECLFFLGADSGEDAWEIPRHGMPENAREYRSGVYKSDKFGIRDILANMRSKSGDTGSKVMLLG